jgi:NADH:ubiquinone oxidoreductase subunit 2 (subunit N)
LLTALVIVLISSATCLYYIRLIKTFFFVKTSKTTFWISSKKRYGLEFCVSLLLFFNVVFAVYPEPLLQPSIALGLTIF